MGGSANANVRVIMCNMPLFAQQEIHGWYQLLDDVKGRLESTPVPEMVARVGSWSNLSSNSSTTVPRNYAVSI